MRSPQVISTLHTDSLPAGILDEDVVSCVPLLGLMQSRQLLWCGKLGYFGLSSGEVVLKPSIRV